MNILKAAMLQYHCNAKKRERMADLSRLFSLFVSIVIFSPCSFCAKKESVGKQGAFSEHSDPVLDQQICRNAVSVFQRF